jgi:crossover junction endodeoxyribonuclease RuvC
MRVVGIDPGFTGAIAVLDVALSADGKYLSNLVAVHDMPVFELKSSRGTKKKHLDLKRIPELITNCGLVRPDHIFIEEVSAAPGQGVVSMFRFGYVAGALAGVVAGLGLTLNTIRPQVWQANVQVTKGNDEGRARAKQLFPEQCSLFTRAKDHNRADAAMIALAGAKTLIKNL